MSPVTVTNMFLTFYKVRKYYFELISRPGIFWEYSHLSLSDQISISLFHGKVPTKIDETNTTPGDKNMIVKVGKWERG